MTVWVCGLKIILLIFFYLQNTITDYSLFINTYLYICDVPPGLFLIVQVINSGFSYSKPEGIKSNT